MKILFVMHNNNYYSGANLAMQEVIKDLLKRENIEISILYPIKGGTADKYYNDNGVETIFVPYWISMLSETDGRLKNIIKYPLLFLRYIKMKRSCMRMKNDMIDVDLVYTNTSSIKFGLMLSKKYNKAHIWHIREFGDNDHRLIYPLGKRYYFSLARKTMSEIVTISQCLFEARQGYFDESKMHLIYDNIDQSYINPGKVHLDFKGLNILMAGDIKKGKGQLVAVEALCKIHQNKDVDIQLFIAGKVGDSKYKSEIDVTISKNSLEEKVHFLGHVSDMNKLRRNMNVGIVASVSEAFGRVTVEGMLSNMAMIGRNSGATCEIIDHGINGLLYDGTADDLAEKILYLSDGSLRTKIIKNAFDRAKDTYTDGSCEEMIAQLIVKTYEKRGGKYYGK